MKKTKTWILVADGARARIFRNDGPDRGLQRAIASNFGAPRAPDRAYGTDRPGRARRGPGGPPQGFAPAVDWHRYEKTRFARDMAALLNRHALRRSFDRLVLVAPPAVLGDLRRNLDKPALAAVTAEVAKDLTHLTRHELPRRLEDVMVL
ncbi:MAG: host attachment protein [Hyphomicrobiales bacterium]|nr:host attachment protein [Hyphomicrobiales bacterium]